MGKRVHLGMRPTAPLQKISLGRYSDILPERPATLAILMIASPFRYDMKRDSKSRVNPAWFLRAGGQRGEPVRSE